MDKAGFLKELRYYLMVLDEREQKDILDEYAQHIDMKMASGMSEAEAIRDFGAIEEFASEILEAYHVDPQYGSGNRKKTVHKEELPIQGVKEAGSRIFKNGSGLMKHFGVKLAAILKRMGCALMMPVHAVKGYVIRIRKKNTFHQGSKPVRADLAGTGRRWIRQMTKGVKRLMKTIWNIFLTGVRWCWNCMMAGFAVMAGLAALFCVFCTGMLVVLMAQGYPLTGVTIGCFGAVMCSGALTALALSQIRLRHGRQIKDSKKVKAAALEAGGAAYSPGDDTQEGWEAGTDEIMVIQEVKENA